jgi:Fic family protein
MKIEDFKSGRYIPQYKYKSFSPEKINHEWIWEDAKINTLLAEANIRIGELNAFSLYVPNIDIFIKMHIVKEATTSSKIEGTRTEVEDAVQKESEIDPEKRDDWLEVQNYIEAMNHSVEELSQIPLSTRLLKEAHKILMQGVRGENKTPGEFRQSQNWIGGATINDAAFIPPHQNEVSGLMGDLENFLHNENIDVPQLIKIAIAHYQFETIHPFLDGNGRVGRLLITLYLLNSGLLQKPTLYLSDYFGKYRTLYYDNLNQIRASSNLSQWIKFFLVAVIETSKKGVSTFRSILKLKEEIDEKLMAKVGKRLPKARDLVNYLYGNPVITISDATNYLKVHSTTSTSVIEELIKIGVLIETTGGKRNRIFEFHEYLNLFTERTIRLNK